VPDGPFIGTLIRKTFQLFLCSAEFETTQILREFGLKSAEELEVGRLDSTERKPIQIETVSGEDADEQGRLDEDNDEASRKGMAING